MAIMELKTISGKEKLALLESSFGSMLSNYNNKVELEKETKNISQILSFLYKYHFSVKVIFSVNNLAKNPLFVMSVYPTMDTISKITNAMATGKNSVVSTLWEKNTDWIIEIDQRILDPHIIKLTASQLTAIMLHEIGHIADSNAVPTRISNVLGYHISSSPIGVRNMMKDNLFQRVLSLPVLNACIADDVKSKKALSHEVKADKFVSHVGYKNDLIDAINSLYKCKYYPRDINTPGENMRQVSAFSTDTLNQFKNRNDSLVKRSLFELKENCNSPYIADAIEWIYEGFYLPLNNVSDKTIATKTRLMHETADRLYDSGYSDLDVFEEGVKFRGPKKLRRIEPNQIDYIRIKISSMKNDDDKYMILSYINSKIDIIDYYMSILNNEKASKKYIVPHSQSELARLRVDLMNMKNQAIKTAIKKPYEGLVIAWPIGYEG